MPAAQEAETAEVLARLRPRQRSNTYPADKVKKGRVSKRKASHHERWVLSPVPEDPITPSVHKGSKASFDSLEWEDFENSVTSPDVEKIVGSSVFDANKSWTSTSSLTDPRRDSIDTRFDISAILNRSLNCNWSVSRSSGADEPDPVVSTPTSVADVSLVNGEQRTLLQSKVSENTPSEETEINICENTSHTQTSSHTQRTKSVGITMETKSHRINIRVASGYFEDICKHMDMSKTRISRIKDATKVAEDHISKLIEAQAFLEECETDDFSQIVLQCKDTKKSLLNFVNSADIVLHESEQRERAPSPSKVEARAARELQKENVIANFRKYADLVFDSAKEFEQFLSSAPTSDGQYRVLEDRFRELNSKINPIMISAKDLMKSAMNCGMKDEYRLLNDSLSKLEEVIHETKTNMSDKKVEFGITTNTFHSSSNKLPEIKPPHFSGSHADKIDFYTFKHEFFECLELRNYSASEQVRFLLRTCLQGDAQSSCEGMKSIDEIFTHLQGLYGNVQLLFSTKLAEIRQLGSCQGSNEKRRQWAINVRSKLRYLLNLCKTHNKESDLFHSSLPNEIHNALSREHNRQLSKLLRKNVYASKEEKFNAVLSFMDEVVDDLTFDLNKEVEDVGFGLSVTTISSKGNKSGLPVTQSKPAVKRTHHAQLQEGSGSSKSMSKMKKPAQGKTKSPQVILSQSDDSNQLSPPSSKGNGINKVQNVLASYVPPAEGDCPLCSKKHTHVFYCPEFQSLGPKDRYNSLDRSGICFRCLRLDAKIDFKEREKWFADHEPNCQSQFVCAVSGCRKKPRFRQLHIVICGWHSEGNQSQEDAFLKSLDQSKIKQGLKFFFNCHLSAFKSSPAPPEALVTRKSSDGFEILPDVHEPAIYFLHKIPDERGNPLLVFYDSGCSSSALSNRAYNNLTTETVRSGPTVLNVAGNQQIIVEHGDERFFLELDGVKKKATLTGLRMDSVTSQFPLLQLQEAWNDVQKAYEKGHANSPPLPTVQESVGGTEVDIMIGIRYLKFFPKEVFTLPCGLGVYRAQIRAYGGHQGVLGGPHRAWRNAEESSNFMSPQCFFTSEMRAFVSQDIALHSLIGPLNIPECDSNELPKVKVVNCNEPTVDKICSFVHCNEHETKVESSVPITWNVLECNTARREIKDFIEAEDLGTDVSYRCVKCRNCANCRKGEILEKVSLIEEQEQALIEDCVTLDVEKKRLYSKLPFIQDPLLTLTPNLNIAEAVLRTQVNAAQKCETTKEDIIKSHEKLKQRGFVMKVDDLDPEYKLRYDEIPGPGYYIPWRVVHKASSLSTPVRMVFDASARTPGGQSLNAILAKGQNSLASLLRILIKFRSLPYAFTGDIKMAYNNVFLDPAFVKFHKYLWRDDLDPKNPLITMVVLTLIYGVRPSGNLTIAGFDVLSKHCHENHPEHSLGADVLKDGSYMDDVLSAHRTLEECRKAAKDLMFALNLGSMSVKSFTFSGEDPSDEVSIDLIHIGILGYLWASRDDSVKLDIKELYFGKPKRGKLPPTVKGDFGEALIKGHFTRRTLTGKVAGVFDPLGLVTPISAKLKLDLHELCSMQLDWDDKIPDCYLEKWVMNLERIQELREIEFRRTLVPHDAADLDVELVISSDASKDIAIATVHSRVKKNDGSYDVQLIAAKSKLVHTSTIPRGELTSALLGALLSHTTRMILQDQVKDYIHVTDSSIVLFWIMTDSRPLQVAVRNRVIEIRRLTDVQRWFHIESENNIADLGTREAKVKDIGAGSEWQCGKWWMSKPFEEMPVKTSTEVAMSAEEKRAAAEEMKAQDFGGMTIMHLTDKVAERYAYSKYLVDPCQHPWPKVLKIFAAVKRFITRVKSKKGISVGLKPVKATDCKAIVFTEEELKDAEVYFFRKCTKEVKQFAKPKDWKECSAVRDGILHYTGRILDGQEIDDVEKVMTDLSPLSFVKPMIDRYSPVAYSIMLHSHQELSTHRNSVTTLRESRSLAFVIHGRDLAIEIRESCLHCRRFKAKLLEVEMGKVHDSRLTIAPCFYFAQVDLFGPLTAICEHNHRSTCKVYGTVFKDPSTGAVAVYLMQNYSTPAFLQAFTRFSCRFGYPKKLFIDEGSQLMKACRQMEISFKDVSESIFDKHQVGIEFETCPVGGHNANGIVERSIREIKKIFNAVYGGLKLDMISYETAFHWTANEMNNIPICLGSRTDNLEHTDLITPNRLMLGRNNRRAPVDCAVVPTPSRLMEQMNKVRDAWWKVWASEKLQDYIPVAPKWSKSSPKLKVGDIVYFLLNTNEDSIGAPKFKIARVKEVEVSNDGQVRHVILEYKNANESVFRTTRRATRKIALIFPEGELELVDHLNAAAKKMNIAFVKAKEKQSQNES